ncbi:MAG: tRNA (guanosine(37)-N1)-methyltransferase TrmD [Ornithinimicrobium sp.]
MRLDVVTIFPDYFQPLGLSLIGKAQREGLLDLHVHDLRAWTSDRHRTVDGPPAGGGAGMVMRPEPWGEALDSLATMTTTSGPDTRTDRAVPHLVVPAPAGERFTQQLAADLAQEPWLAFACGRYEGIDERVIDEAREQMPVTVVSLGDYVLNGGEVATLAIIEAVARLVPGVIGNTESLIEESHSGGLLEYPVYTKPKSWRGRDVPTVLSSGDHGAIEAWRHEQRIRRTAERRPDLLSASAAVTFADGIEGTEDLILATAEPRDAAEIMVLSRACWLPEGREHDSFEIPALAETVDDVALWLTQWHTWTVRVAGRLIGGVRARRSGDNWDIGRLMVSPDLQGRGLGSALLTYAEAAAPADVRGYVLFTGGRSVANLRMYKRAGYRITGRGEYAGVPTVELFKPRR